MAALRCIPSDPIEERRWVAQYLLNEGLEVTALELYEELRERGLSSTVPLLHTYLDQLDAIIESSPSAKQIAEEQVSEGGGLDSSPPTSASSYTYPANFESILNNDTPNIMEYFKRSFNYLDSNNDSRLSVNEVQHLVVHIGLDCEPSQVKFMEIVAMLQYCRSNDSSCATGLYSFDNIVSGLRWLKNNRLHDSILKVTPPVLRSVSDSLVSRYLSSRGLPEEALKLIRLVKGVTLRHQSEVDDLETILNDSSISLENMLMLYLGIDPKSGLRNNLSLSISNNNSQILNSETLFKSTMTTKTSINTQGRIDPKDINYLFTNTVDVMATSLLQIVPNVIIAKRSEVIPIVLHSIWVDDDRERRQQLTKLFFNLVKRPNAEQRLVIINGCREIAGKIGPERVGNEFLPICCEQVSSKHSERRTLVAEACGALASFVSPDLRVSLLFSILQQLMDDNDGVVRLAVVNSMTVVVKTFGSDQVTKIPVVMEFMSALLLGDADVYDSVIKGLLPVVLKWCKSCNSLWSLFFSYFLDETFRVIERSMTTKSEDSRLTFQKIRKYLLVFDLLIPEIFKELVESILEENIKDLTLVQMHEKFDDWLSRDAQAVDTTAFNWAAGEIWAKLIGIAKSLHSPDTFFDCMECLVRCTHHLCSELGENFTQTIVVEVFKPEITIRASDISGNRVIDATAVKNRNCLLPLYALGVLPTVSSLKASSKEPRPIQATPIYSFLSKCFIDCGTEERGWTKDHIPVIIDCSRMCLNLGDLPKISLISIVHELVNNSTDTVRFVVVLVLGQMVDDLSVEEVGKDVVPSLLLLAGDSNRNVLRCCATSLGRVLLHITDRSLLERIENQLTIFIDGSDLEIVITIFSCFEKIIPEVSPVILNGYILPKLLLVSRRISESKIDLSMRPLAYCLFNTLRAVNSRVLSGHEKKDFIIPTLRCLLSNNMLDENLRNMGDLMLRDFGEFVTEPVSEKAVPGKSFGSFFRK